MLQKSTSPINDALCFRCQTRIKAPPNPSVDIPYKTEKKKKKKRLCLTQHRQYIASSSPTQLSTKKHYYTLTSTHTPDPRVSRHLVKSRGSPPKRKHAPNKQHCFDPYTTRKHQAQHSRNTRVLFHTLQTDAITRIVICKTIIAC